MPNFLPIRLQNILHRRQSSLQTKIILSQGIEGLPEGRPFCFVLRGTATISNNMLYLIAGLFRSRYNTDLVEALC